MSVHNYQTPVCLDKSIVDFIVLCAVIREWAKMKIPILRTYKYSILLTMNNELHLEIFSESHSECGTALEKFLPGYELRGNCL